MPAVVTLDAYTGVFLDRYSKARQKASWRSDQAILRQIAAFTFPCGTRFGAQPIRSITEDDIEICLQALKDRGLAASTRNKYLQTFKAMSAWGLRKGYLTEPWFGPLSDLKREAHARRSRRVLPDEESRLLAKADTRLYRLIVAAIESGCRQGELLAVRWQHVDLTRRENTLPASVTKNGRERLVPISRRLLAVLEMAQHDPAGHRFGPEAYIFRDAIGRRRGSPKKAWETAVLRAHVHTPQWSRPTNRLTDASREAYQAIDLHFHDFKHEAGSRWLEAGVPLHHVKELLGHANIATTDTYLNAGRVHLKASIAAADARKSGANVAQSGGENAAPPTAGIAGADGKPLVN